MAKNNKYAQISMSEEEPNKILMSDSMEIAIQSKILAVSSKEMLKKLDQESSNLSLEKGKDKMVGMLKIIYTIQKDAEHILSGKTAEYPLSEYSHHILQQELINIAKYNSMSEYILSLYERENRAHIESNS
jgi:hypothetical protein